jgi:hypothetical protein
MRMSHTQLAAVSVLIGTILAAPAVSAQPQQGKAVAPIPTAPAAQEPAARPFQMNAEQTRRELNTILRQYPPMLDDILRMDPSLMSNRDYLAMYPTLRDFLAAHPEIAHNPSYFVGEHQEQPGDSESYRIWRDVTETVSIFMVVFTIVGVLVWLTKTAIDHRRWLRVSRLQEDIHSRLMDRLTTNEDLLAYIQTPAGQNFLQQAPIPLEAGPQALSAPLGRILWSAQTGLVLAFGGLGLYYAFSRLTPDKATEPFFVISILALSLGVGFIVSAAVALAFSQRLGLLENVATRQLNQNKPTL